MKNSHEKKSKLKDLNKILSFNYLNITIKIKFTSYIIYVII